MCYVCGDTGDNILHLCVIEILKWDKNELLKFMETFINFFLRQVFEKHWSMTMTVLLTNNGIKLLAQLQLKAKNIFSATQTHKESQNERRKIKQTKKNMATQF